jgi:hypothetical protein
MGWRLDDSFPAEDLSAAASHDENGLSDARRFGVYEKSVRTVHGRGQGQLLTPDRLPTCKASPSSVKS